MPKKSEAEALFTWVAVIGGLEVTMPKILEDRVKAIMKGNPNMSRSRAFAIATSALQKEGKMERGSQKLKGKGKRK